MGRYNSGIAERNVVQRAFDAFGKSRFEAKRSGTWTRRIGEVEQSLNLQKSQYSLRYYVNVALAFDTHAGRGRIVGRAESLLPTAQGDHLQALLDIDGSEIEDERREHELLRVLDLLMPTLDELRSVEALTAHDKRGTFKAMGVTGPARAAFDEAK